MKQSVQQTSVEEQHVTLRGEGGGGGGEGGQGDRVCISEFER